MGLDRCLTEKNGVFTSELRLQETQPLLESIVAVQGVGTLQFYSVDTTDLGEGLFLGNGRYANPIGGESAGGKIPVSGVVLFEENTDYFLTADSTATFPDVTGFVGGESVKVIASIAATSSTLTVDGTQGEEIAPSNGNTPEIDFDLTDVGVGFDFIFNAVTGNWEV